MTPTKPACIGAPSPQAYWHIDTIDIADAEQYASRTRDIAQVSEPPRYNDSGSTIIALAWSYPGLGVGGRPVLAILTSNLVLSLWETDGTLGYWRRTLLLNSVLDGDKEEKFGSEARPGTGVHGFCWLPPMPLGSTDKNGAHHIVTIDSCGALTIFYMDALRTDIDIWLHDPAFYDDLDVPEELFSSRDAINSSTDQPQTGPLVAISVEDWQYPSTKVGEPQKARTKVHLKYRLDAYHDMSYHLRALYNNKPSFILSDLSLYGFEVRSCGADHHAAPDFSDFDAALADSQYAGYHATRFWGTAYSEDRTMQAAYITFRPPDVIKNGSQSTCAILFTSGYKPAAPAPPLKSLRMIQQGIIAHAVAMIGSDTIKSQLDTQMLASISACIKAAFPQALLVWSKRVEEVIAHGNGLYFDPRTGNKTCQSQLSLLGPETCRICDSLLDAKADLSGAECENQHYFKRCCITFLPILKDHDQTRQCNRCGRLFLRMSELGPIAGSGLVHALIEKFQICPYCYYGCEGGFRD